MTKKLKLALIGFVAFISLCSLEDTSGSNNPFWDWSYQNVSGTISLSGTGTCYQE